MVQFTNIIKKSISVLLLWLKSKSLIDTPTPLTTPPPKKKKKRINILKYILVKNQFDEYIENI